MASTGIDTPLAVIDGNGKINGLVNGEHDHILRPRPQKAQIPQLADLIRQQNGASNAGLLTPGDSIASGPSR
jgi:hypothetical protein